MGHAFAMMAFTGDLPAAAAGQWCRVVLAWPGPGPLWAKLELSDSARGQIVREAFFPPQRRINRVMLIHVPQAAGLLTLSLFMPCAASTAAPALCLQVLGRAAASMRLLAGGWPSLASALRGSPLGLIGRARALLGQGAARRGQAPPYRVWIDLYDKWGDQERKALLAGAADRLRGGACALGPACAVCARAARADPQARRQHGEQPAAESEGPPRFRGHPPGDHPAPHDRQRRAAARAPQ